MGIQKYHTSVAKVWVWLSLILFLIGFIVLFSNLGKGYHQEEEGFIEQVFVYILTFGMGTILFIIAIWRMKQAEELVYKPNLSKVEEGFFSARRMMLVSTNPFSFYALNGNEIATSYVISQTNKYTRIFLHMFYITPFLSTRLKLEAEGRQITILKPLGFKNNYYIYDENEELLSIFQLEGLLGIKYNVITKEGKIIATTRATGSTERFTLEGANGHHFLTVQLGGIPREALELFGNVEGDIIDIAHEDLDHTTFMQIIAFPIIIRLMTQRY